MNNMHIKMMLTTELRRLEYDPIVQYKFNLWCAWIWLLQMPLVAIALIFFNQFWIQISIFYVAEASVWALVATHFGAMSAAYQQNAKLNPKE
jgi:hypothetical protein